MSEGRKSSLVPCPICNRLTPEWYINDHIDNNCSRPLEAPPSSPPSRNSTLGFPAFQKRKSGQLSSDEEDVRPEPAPPGNHARHHDAGSSISLSNGTTSIIDASVVNPPGKRQKISDSIAQAKPLAERVRPTDFSSFVGQDELMGPKGILRNLMLKDRIPSMILWGPPGSGKTTAARLIARMTRSRFVEMGAVTHATSDVRRAFEDARNLLALTGQRTILFLDEIHRFNRAQQDIFLPHVERGAVTLVGATTENPSFKVNAALLSRCRVFVMAKLSEQEIVRILKRAMEVWRRERVVGTDGEEEVGQEQVEEVLQEQLKETGREPMKETGREQVKAAGRKEVNTESRAGVKIEEAQLDEETKALHQLARISDGDARHALNILDLALAALPDPDQLLLHEDVKNAFQKSHLLYDRVGEEHYNSISALHKSIRGSDANAALYWLARMLVAGEDPVYVARRLIRCASEDIGLADNQALPLAVSTYQACQVIGMPECDVILAHCVTYLAETKKSVRSYQAYELAKQTVREEPAYPVPLHIRNAPTELMKTLGYGVGYKYNPDYQGPVEQDYLPSELNRRRYLDAEQEAERGGDDRVRGGNKMNGGG